MRQFASWVRGLIGEDEGRGILGPLECVCAFVYRIVSKLPIVDSVPFRLAKATTQLLQL